MDPQKSGFPAPRQTKARGTTVHCAVFPPGFQHFHVVPLRLVFSGAQERAEQKQRSPAASIPEHMQRKPTTVTHI